MSSSIAPSVKTAVDLLTTPHLLSSTFDHVTIASLRKGLTMTLEIMANKPNYHIVLRMSSKVLPPTPILTTCMATQVSWGTWCLALTAGKDISTVMEITPQAVAWTGNVIKPVVVRISQGPRKQAAMFVGSHKFAVSAPRETRPASPASSVSSGASSIFDSGRLSPSSTLASSPASSRCHSRAPSFESLSVPERRSAHRLTVSKPIIDTSATEVMAYKYAGGETNVVGGGVMLGGGLSQVKAANKENKKVIGEGSPSKKTSRPRAASRATSWRRA